jgi:predicted small secreted protein
VADVHPGLSAAGAAVLTFMYVSAGIRPSGRNSQGREGPMRKLVISSFIAAYAAIMAGCHETAKGVEQDTKDNANWVEHHV